MIYVSVASRTPLSEANGVYSDSVTPHPLLQLQPIVTLT